MPNRRPDEPIAPATIPGRPLDPKIPPDQQADDDVGTGEHGNEILSASLHRTPPETSSDRVASGNAQFGSAPPAERKIPDRSAEPAVQESLDREKSTTAATSDDVPLEAQSETRDDEGNVIEGEAKDDEASKRARPDSDAGSQ
jgi:hypothetical protein